MKVPSKLQIALAIVICRSKQPYLTIEEYIDYIREVLYRRNRKKEVKEICECSNTVSFWKNMFESMDRENVKLRIKIMELEKGLNKEDVLNKVKEGSKNECFDSEMSRYLCDMEKIDVLQHDSGSEKLYDSFRLFYLSCLRLKSPIIGTLDFRSTSVFETFQRLCKILSSYITDSISMALNNRRINAFRTILEYIAHAVKFSWDDESYYINSFSSVFDALFELIRYQSSYYLTISSKNLISSGILDKNSYVDERYEIVCLISNITNQFYTLFPIVVDLLVKHIKISYTRCQDRDMRLAIRNSENSACGYYLYNLSVLCRKNRRISPDNLEQLIRLVEGNFRDFRCFELDKLLWNSICYLSFME
ncbi:hypothetical protein PNEG_01010 [Pneumocystis murina B123]|uniref:Uncharacterized protein n=1 Tax=Pneumocystis murina (strain B123) TaxID=1069680 RepID=M7PK88_PNEMU|nr:hypothetical protein PNEG_01010 [Pneumocystis murina B123]EMR10864.1 hypothetical protein PNEG_01010 [Pneumocystis murina B123]